MASSSSTPNPSSSSTISSSPSEALKTDGTHQPKILIPGELLARIRLTKPGPSDSNITSGCIRFGLGSFGCGVGRLLSRGSNSERRTGEQILSLRSDEFSAPIVKNVKGNVGRPMSWHGRDSAEKALEGERRRRRYVRRRSRRSRRRGRQPGTQGPNTANRAGSKWRRGSRN
ncbi:hypothetical protein BJV77DRAFT_968436 [Russula vinacea]|nr:hypothetical protein BJV77DRAFT_968436 [Russula vinacea]